MGLDTDQDVHEIVVRIDVVQLAGGHEALEDGEILPGFVVADEEKIVAPEREDPERSFAHVVVERDLWIIEEDGQRLPLIERVADGLAHRREGAPPVRATRRGHLWVFVGRKYDPDGDLSLTREFVFYLYPPTWHARYPEEFLRGCNAVLQGDAYRGYERIADPHLGDAAEKLLAGCCMHARRPFVQALEARDPAAIFFVQNFQALYGIEAEARTRALRARERLELRQERSLPILKQMQERAHELSALPLAKPMQNGVTYLINQWDKLLVPFTLDGRLEIDNGSAERRLRPVASGRKAWLFAGSPAGAERFADLLSLVSTAEAAGVNPGSYIADCRASTAGPTAESTSSCFTSGLSLANKPPSSPPQLSSLPDPCTTSNPLTH